MNCSVCGTSNPDEFHINSLIGYGIASRFEEEGCGYGKSFQGNIQYIRKIDREYKRYKKY